MKSKDLAKIRLIIMHVSDKAETPQDRRNNAADLKNGLKRLKGKVYREIEKLAEV